ncbi:MAG TPA: hypothetical protein VGG39_15325 [Polyangiaceae bacterium]|jgi:hypothetical protein
MVRGRFFLLLAGVLAVAASLTTLVSSCSQTPTNVPVRTFELAQKMDVVCMNVLDESGQTLSDPVPVREDECAPVPINVDGGALPNHLFGTVTQLARGELAVVDLTNGNVVDEDKSTPGINFIPVGLQPTDVVVAPDGQMTFVSSADPQKPAIYAIPSARLLGDSTGPSPKPPLELTDLFACALPQPPAALTVAPTASGGYVVLAMLEAFAGQGANIAAIDPGPMLGGAQLEGGEPDAASIAGGLLPCKVLGATGLTSNLPKSWTPGPAWPDGVPYADAGIAPDAEPSPGPSCATSPQPTTPEGGLPLPPTFGSLDPPNPKAMAMRDDVPLLYVSDQSVPIIHVIDVSDPTNPREQAPLLATSIVEPRRRVILGAIAISPPTHDYKRYLYAVDSSDFVSSVIVFDITDPVASPHVPMQRPHPELNPFSPPDRLWFSAPVSTLAFVQHDWSLPSPSEGTSPIHQYTGLLCNPSHAAHPNPTDFDDRGAYYRADQAGLIQTNGTLASFPYRLRGVFAFVTLSNGVVVTVDIDDWDAPCRRPDPMDGTNVLGSLDVPEPDGGSDANPYGVPQSYTADVPGTNGTSQEQFFPVSAPNRVRSNFILRNDPVTTGVHIPYVISAPTLYDVNGATVPTNVVSSPLLMPAPLPPGFVDYDYLSNPIAPDPTTPTFSNAALESASGQSAAGSVALVPGPNTSGAGVRLSFDDPTAHQDQDWTTTYEGALPSVTNIDMDIASYDGYQTLILATGALNPDEDAGADASVDASFSSALSPSPGFCARGVEDWDVGQARANAVVAAIAAAKLTAPGTGALASAENPTLPQWTTDYVEIADDLLGPDDPYWAIPSSDAQDCWDGSGLEDDRNAGISTSPNAAARYQSCATLYGADGEDAAPEGSGSVADLYYARDLPILQAYDDHLVLGRFGWYTKDSTGNDVSEQPTNRVVVPGDASNPPFLKQIRCCFHHQATFKVRTGGEWLTVGSTTGLLHHVQTDPATSRCVLGCDPREVLENARSFDIPWAQFTQPPPYTSPQTPTCNPPPLGAQLDRNSVLAMRNPMFSFVTWSGCDSLLGNDHTETARDLQWKFSIRGGFTPVTVSLSQNTNTAVSPQSMRFIDSTGQLAVVDGAQQGLILIDLNTLQFAHNPYY